MAYTATSVFLSAFYLFNLMNHRSFFAYALSSCNGPCHNLNDCSGQLICINGKCNDDPNVGTHICNGPLSSCNGPCRNLNDCSGQLICINGKCNDDPNVGAHICRPTTSGGTCGSSGTLNCNGKSYPQYTCSPPVSSSTEALLTLNDFSEGGAGGDPSSCDERFHANTERVVALSTGWYNGGSRCLKMIRIAARNGRSVTAKVVDECDSVKWCDREHAWQPPCRNNVEDGSKMVWDALGLNTDVGVELVTWSMA